MALDRLIPNSTTPGLIGGDNFMDATQEELTGLWNYSRIPITVTGTNDLVATPVPALTGALVNGMGFVFRAAATNTSTTMRLNVGTGLFTLVTRAGAGPAVGSIVNGNLYEAIWVSAVSAFMLTSYLPAVGFDDRPSFRNLLGANGGCEIWQRGTSIAVAASTAPYTLDRWYLSVGANQASTVFRGAFGDSRSEFAAVAQRNNGQTGTGQMTWGYPFTLSECARMRGQQVTLTARLSIGANWSPASGTLGYQLQVGTGAEKKAILGFTTLTTPINGTINLTGTTTIAVTSASVIPLTTTQAEVLFYWNPTGTAGAQDWVVIDDVQLECGTVATEFEYVPFEYSLRLCQAHYAKTFPYGTAPAQAAGLAGAISGDKDIADLIAQIAASNSSTGWGNTIQMMGSVIHWRLPVEMRTTPTITTFNPSAANANIRLPTGGTAGTTAVDSAVTVSPHSSTGSKGVTMCGVGALSGIDNSGTGETRDLIGYIHATADAGL